MTTTDTPLLLLQPHSAIQQPGTKEAATKSGPEQCGCRLNDNQRFLAGLLKPTLVQA
jgi:hypothetical protein